MGLPRTNTLWHTVVVYFFIVGATIGGPTVNKEEEIPVQPPATLQGNSAVVLDESLSQTAPNERRYQNASQTNTDGYLEESEEGAIYVDPQGSEEHQESHEVHISQAPQVATGNVKGEASTAVENSTVHRRKERDTWRTWSDVEGSGSDEDVEWDDEDLFLQQRRASRRGRKGRPKHERRRRPEWLQRQGPRNQRTGQQPPEASRQQGAAKNELPSRTRSRARESPSRQQHANTAKRRSRKRHRTKARRGGGPTQPPPQPPPRPAPAPRLPPPPAPQPRRFGGGSMSLESRIRELKKINSGDQDDAVQFVGPGLWPAMPPEPDPLPPHDVQQWDDRWPPTDDWTVAWDDRSWQMMESGLQPRGDHHRPISRQGHPGLAPPPHSGGRQLPVHSTVATPVTGETAAHGPPPTQSRHFAYHRVTEALSAADASHHQEAFVAVSMVDLPCGRKGNHSERNHTQASNQDMTTRSARLQPATTALPFFDRSHMTDRSGRRYSGAQLSDYDDQGAWVHVRHRGRTHGHRGAMEKLMNRHREEQWIRRRFGLPLDPHHG